jgi:hypothetical protein
MTALEDTTDPAVERSWRSALGLAAVCCWTVLVAPMAFIVWWLWWPTSFVRADFPSSLEEMTVFALGALVVGLPLVGVLVWKKKSWAIVAIIVALTATVACYLMRMGLALLVGCIVNELHGDPCLVM